MQSASHNEELPVMCFFSYLLSLRCLFDYKKSNLPGISYVKCCRFNYHRFSIVFLFNCKCSIFVTLSCFSFVQFRRNFNVYYIALHSVLVISIYFPANLTTSSVFLVLPTVSSCYLS